MIGKSSLIWFALACLASAILYHTSYQVQSEAERLANLRRQIGQQQQSIQVLKAEWAYLNDPKRIERLAAEHTGLKPIKGTQIASFDALPARPDQPFQAPATLLAQAPAATPAATPAVAKPAALAAATAPKASAPKPAPVLASTSRSLGTIVAQLTQTAVPAKAAPGR